MPLSAVDVVNPAFERMKILFNPFRLGQWLRFALVGFLAGEMGQGGGCSARLPLDVLTSQTSNELQGPISPERGPLFIIGIVLLVLLVLTFGVILAYLNSRMRFVLFDSILSGECRIRHFWSRRGVPAFGYFIFQIVLSLIGLTSLVVLVGIPALIVYGLGWFSNPGQHILGFVLVGSILGMLFLAWVVVMVLVQVLTKDFVVPQMAIDGVSLSEGWNRLWSQVKDNRGAYAGYIGMKIILRIAAVIATGVATVIVLLVLLIPFGGVALVTVLLAQAAGIGWNPLTIAIAIVFGCVVFLLFLFLACLLAVPSIVFFPAYAMYFFAERYPALHALLYLPPAEPDLSTLSPQP
ncbi:MAG TPA: hypothetical protein VFR18_07520 [Terriglobia bacterium]|nr:hypothetical protein [Terriglobia bacterium]